MMTPLIHGRLGRFVGLSSLLCLVLGTACSAEEETGDSSDEIQLEQQPIPTLLKELRAGQGYLPGIDEAPIVAANPCLSNAKIVARGGNSALTASFVESRKSLNIELGLDASGTLPIAGGLSAVASLSAKTQFDSRSAAVVFQVLGTYESTVNTEAVPAAFDPAKVSSCGYGFVSRAQHRVAAALVVNMESTSANVDVRGNATVGKANVAEAKANLATVINKGNVKISLRFASDVIPDLPPPPFAEGAVLAVGDQQSEKQTAINKIETALSWLAQANVFVQKYLLALQTGGDSAPPPAPTEKVTFRYYPQTPADVRGAVEATAKNALDTRKRMAEAATMAATWEAFVTAAKAGRGHEWNVPAELADSVEALRSKANGLVGEQGKIQSYQDSLSQALETCTLALRNEGGGADVVAGLKNGCKPPAAFPFDKAKNTIRPIAVVSAAEVDGALRTCRGNSRLPTQKEANVFKAWSAARKAHNQGGLWTEDGPSCLVSGFAWLSGEGKVECSGFFSGKGLSVCVSKTLGPFPEE